MIRFLFIAIITLSTAASFAQEDCNCQTQLIRMDVAGGAINNLLSSNPQLEKFALPSIETFVRSDAFKTNVVKDYPMEPMGFPFNAIVCEKEKSQGDPKFKDIDCKNPLLCADQSIPESVRNEICVSLPCSMILGSEQMGKCPVKGVARPSMVHYSEPIGLKALEMTPTSITSENNVLRACFTVDKMEATAGVSLEFAKDPVVEYEQMGISKLKVELDGKREICMSSKIDLTSDKPVSEIKFERMNGNFVSDSMINKALASSELHGLSGYSPATLSVLKLTVAPQLARYFRPAMEEAIQKALGTTFEIKISDFIAQMAAKKDPSTIATPTNSMMSEMGVGNLSVKKYVDLMECSILKAQKKQIPADHACLTQVYPGKKKPLKHKEIPSTQEALNKLRESMNNNDHVTSESLRLRLVELDKDMNGALKPLSDKISDAQLKSTLISGVQVISHIGNSNSMSGVGVSIPDICDVLNPSAHAGRSIPNCPIQTYIDTEELNKLMDAMYKSGRLCNRGSGDYKPELNNKGEQVRNSDGSPRGTGCLFAIEEDEDGFRCFLNGAPKLKFDSKTNGYKIHLNTKECFRGAVALGQGKVAGDINFEIGYTPAICGQGDFCLENGQASWNVVPGTARYALKESSFLNGIVRRTIDKKLDEVIGQTIRLPLSSGEGAMSQIPLAAEGRIDVGPGYFGACLKVK